MNTHSIRHAWFPPTIPKRKCDGEFDVESERSTEYSTLGEPSLDSRPSKRLRHLEGGLAKLTLRAKNQGEPIAIDTDLEFLAPAHNPTNQGADPLSGGDTKPTVYEHASPHTGVASRSASLEILEVNTSDEEGAMGAMGGRYTHRMESGNGVFVQGGNGTPGYIVYEPESGHEKRKRGVEDDEHRLEKKGKMTWYEPEKDRIVVLDLDSSEDESVLGSPHRRRSTFSHSPTSQRPPTRSRASTRTQEDAPGFSINSTLLSHISSPGARVPSIPREDNPAQALVLYKPPSWAGDAPQVEGTEVADIQTVADGSRPASMEASPLIQDYSEGGDEMDIDP